jgi:hypothetical protein
VNLTIDHCSLRAFRLVRVFAIEMKKLIITPVAIVIRRLREYSAVFAVQFSMKKTLGPTRLPILGILAAAMLLTGCITPKNTEHYRTAPVYDTAVQIKAMPPCKARVVQRAPCHVYLKTSDGNGFYLGGPGSEADVGRFLRVLKDGQRYDFPDAFLKFEENHQATQP